MPGLRQQVFIFIKILVAVNTFFLQRIGKTEGHNLQMRPKTQNFVAYLFLKTVHHRSSDDHGTEAKRHRRNGNTDNEGRK